MAKVKPGTKNGTETDEKKKGRIDFPIKGAKYVNADDALVSAVNKDGLLIGVPITVKDGEGKVTYAGFDIRKHKGLGKAAFADIATYMRYQAFINRERAARLIALADEKDKKADRIEKFGDEATRKKAAKVARMRETLAAMEAQLVEEGVDIEDL